MRPTLSSVLASLVLAGCAPDPSDTDPEQGLPPLVVDTDGAFGPDVPDASYLRAVALMPDAGGAALSFNGTGVVLASDLPYPAVTPLLPRTVDSTSMELSLPMEAGLQEVVSVGPYNLGTPLSEVVAWGTIDEPRGMVLELATPPTPGSLTVRLVHTTPGLAYAGLGPAVGAPDVGATEGAVSDWTVLPADEDITWFLDINGDGVGDVPFEPWSLPAQDGLGQPQIVDIFVVPSGSRLPPPSPPLPVPFLLVVPLTGPDEAIAVLPAL